MSQPIIQPILRFTYATQPILQPFCCFTYVTGTSPTSPGELPMLACCVGRQTDHCSRKIPCPETHDLGAVERRSLRTNVVTISSDSFWCPNTAGMQPFSHLLTFIEMCRIASTLHIQMYGLVEGDPVHDQHGHQILHLSTIFCGIV